MKIMKTSLIRQNEWIRYNGFLIRHFKSFDPNQACKFPDAVKNQND